MMMLGVGANRATMREEFLLTSSISWELLDILHKCASRPPSSGLFSVNILFESSEFSSELVRSEPNASFGGEIASSSSIKHCSYSSSILSCVVLTQYYFLLFLGTFVVLTSISIYVVDFCFHTFSSLFSI